MTQRFRSDRSLCTASENVDKGCDRTNYLTQSFMQWKVNIYSPQAFLKRRKNDSDIVAYHYKIV